MKVFLDIETAPSLAPTIREELAAKIGPPATYSKADSIATWNAEKKPALVEEAWRKTALDGSAGQIAVIGVAIDDGEIATYSIHEVDGFKGLDEFDAAATWSASEKTILEWFFSHLYSAYDPSQDRLPTFIGHNLTAFDLRFIWQRAVINGVQPPAMLPVNPAAWSDRIYDTMTEWAGRGNRISLDRLCRALGMDGKGDDIDGSKVWDYLKDGRFDEVAAYCRADVAKTREIYRRMTFQKAVDPRYAGLREAA
jgi:hypothetical protein